MNVIINMAHADI